MTLAEWVTITKDILVGLSVVSASVFAYFGLSAWRKELKGRAEYQLAKEVLKSVYKVREAFKQVRRPAIYQYEYPEKMRDQHGHLKSEHDHEGMLHVYDERWKVMAEAFNELEEHHLKAQVEWGQEFQNVIMKLRSCRVELKIVIQQMLERKKNPREMGLTKDERTKELSILQSSGCGPEHDKFTPKIDEAINEFEEWLRPHIKHGG